MSSIFDAYDANEETNKSSLVRVGMTAELEEEFEEEEEDYGYTINPVTEALLVYNTESQVVPIAGNESVTVEELAARYSSLLGFDAANASRLNFIHNNKFLTHDTILEPGMIVTISSTHSTKG